MTVAELPEAAAQVTVAVEAATEVMMKAVVRWEEAAIAAEAAVAMATAAEAAKLEG